MKNLFLCAVLVVLSCAALNAGIVIGTPNGGNCIPWSCENVYPGNYQQIYNSTAFSGSIGIGSISFFDTYYNNGYQGIGVEDYSIYLAVTSQSVPDGSIPGGNVLFASGHLDGSVFPFGNTLTFSGTPFLYDPSLGNLELTVLVSNVSGPTGGASYAYFDSQNSGPFSRWCPACGSNSGYGLVTGFGTATGVPEPGTLLLLGFGIAAIAAVRLRKG